MDKHPTLGGSKMVLCFYTTIFNSSEVILPADGQESYFDEALFNYVKLSDIENFKKFEKLKVLF